MRGDKLRGRKAVAINKRFSLAIFLCLMFGVILLSLDRGINAQILIRQILVLSVISMGAVFVFTVGSFGISLGASTLLSVVLGGAVFAYTQSYTLSLLSCIFVPMSVCVGGNCLIRIFKLPSYASAVIILTFCISLSWLTLSLFGGTINTGMPTKKFFGTPGATVLFFLIFTVLCVLMEYILPVGKRQKELGFCLNTARLQGISPLFYSTLAFVFASLGVGIGGFLILCSDNIIEKTQVSDLGFNIIFALFLGGMPVAGGKRSSILCGLIGSVSAVFIREIFVCLSLSDGLPQLIRSIILLVILICFEKINGDFNASY